MTNDLTRGNPAKLILLFTIPLLLGNVFQQFYSMADTVIVGRTISVNALAAVGSTGSLSFLIIGFAQGLTAGFSVCTAQRFGAGDMEGVRKSFAAGAILCAAIAAILTLVSTLFARNILELLGTPADIIDDAYRYLIVIFGGIATSVLFNFLSNIIRALGDSKTPLLFLIIACLINVGLDFLFILAFHMGVAGAAYATILSQFISGALCIGYIVKFLPILHLTRNEWNVGWSVILQHMRIGLPMGFQSSIIALGSMTIQAALNSLGSTAVAAYTAAQKIDQLSTQPLMSFGITMATYTAQNYGAGDMYRIRSGVRQCSLMSVAFSLVAGWTVIFFCRPLLRAIIGTGQEEVVELARIYLIINCALYFILSLLFIYRYTLQGLGKSLIPTIAGIMELIMRVLVAVYMSAAIGFSGICLANPAAWIGAMIPLTSAYFFTIHRLVKQAPQPTSISV